MLLGIPRIGPTVIARLEAAGFDSIEALKQAGVPRVVQAVCDRMGAVGWANRQRALECAVALTVSPSIRRLK
ncbi:MAG: hypothetical protein IH627_12575 [Rubrivivax sp.]|nr:hypothetical protein [Rubrivivax sp.]